MQVAPPNKQPTMLDTLDSEKQAAVNAAHQASNPEMSYLFVIKAKISQKKCFRLLALRISEGGGVGHGEGEVWGLPSLTHV